MRLVREAPGRGVKVFIVGAGAAAHLAGVVAAHTIAAGHRRADRFVGAEGARRAAVDRADAAGRAGRDGLDRQAGRDQRRRARGADPRASAIRRWPTRLDRIQEEAGRQSRTGGRPASAASAPSFGLSRDAYAIVTFGCRVNQADSLRIEEDLRARGASAAPSHDADLVVVNTCSVTATADQGARQTIRRIARDNPAARIVVTGCYATRSADELAALPA